MCRKLAADSSVRRKRAAKKIKAEVIVTECSECSHNKLLPRVTWLHGGFAVSCLYKN